MHTLFSSVFLAMSPAYCRSYGKPFLIWFIQSNRRYKSRTNVYHWRIIPGLLFAHLTSKNDYVILYLIFPKSNSMLMMIYVFRHTNKIDLSLRLSFVEMYAWFFFQISWLLFVFYCYGVYLVKSEVVTEHSD